MDFLNDAQSKIYNNVITYSVMRFPIFTEAIMMTVPYYNKNVKIASIDDKWRLALGDGFFNMGEKYNDLPSRPSHQAFVICHEICHGINLHFQRAKSAHMNDGDNVMLAGDLEINQQFQNMYGLIMPDEFVMPESMHLKPFQRMEYYYSELLKKANNNSQDAPSSSNNGSDNENGQQHNTDSKSSSKSENNESSNEKSNRNKNKGEQETQSDNGSGDKNSEDENDNTVACENYQETSSQADALNIPKPSMSSINMAFQKTKERALEQSKMYGKGSAEAKIADWLSLNMTPAKVDWRERFRKIVSLSKVSKSFQTVEKSYSKVNKRASAFNPEIIMPGLISYDPQIIMALDTSGSMSSKEIRNAVNEVDGIISNNLGKGCFRIFCVDSDVKKIQIVYNIKELNLSGMGGTDMTPAFKLVKNMKGVSKPDLFILATDGFVPWNNCKNVMPDCNIVLLITDSSGMKQIPQWLIQIIGEKNVIDISG